MSALRYFLVLLLVLPAACSHGQSKTDHAESARNAALEEQKRVDELSQAGLAAMKAGDFISAHAYWSEAQSLRKDDSRLLGNLGLVELEMGRLEEALLHTGRAVQLAPDSADLAVNYGLALNADGHTAQAVGEFRRALDLDPLHEPALLALGNGALARGEIQEAERLFKEAVRLRADSAPLHAGWAVTAAHRGDWRVAAERMTKASEIDPGDSYYLASAGALQYRAGATEPAVTLLDRALEISPDLGDALVLRAELAWLVGDYVKAKTLYEVAVAADRPGIERAASSLRKGELAYLLDQPQAARAALEDSLRQSGQPEEWRGRAYSMLGAMSLQRKEWREALGAFEEAQTHLGGTALVHAGLARARHGIALAYEGTHREELFIKAERDYRASLDQQENPALRLQLGAMYEQWAELVDRSYRRGKFHQAEVQFRDALRVKTTSTEAHLRLGLLYARLAEGEAARGAFEAAIAGDPTNSRAVFLYANFLRREGELRKDKELLHQAHVQFRRSMSLDPKFVGAQIGWYLTRGAAPTEVSSTTTVSVPAQALDEPDIFPNDPEFQAPPGEAPPLNEYGEPMTDEIPPELEDLIPFLAPMPEDEWPHEDPFDQGPGPDVIPIKEGDKEPIYSIKATESAAKRPAVYKP